MNQYPGSYYGNSDHHKESAQKGLNHSVVSAMSPTKVSNLQSQEYTEVFSWGNDKCGQLGLGRQTHSNGKTFHTVPRFCSYNIAITQVACGTNHSVFITSNH